MQKHIRFLASTALAFGLSGTVMAEETETTESTVELTAETVLVTVGDEEIKLGHVIAALTTIPQEYQNLPDQSLYDGLLEQLVQQSALASSFTEALPPRIVYQLENEKRSIVAAEVIESVMAKAIEDANLQAIYDEQYGSIDAEEEYNASHILVATKEEADAIKAEIEAGADFAQTAQEKSTGPSGPNGGELGWFSSGMMVPSFEAAAIALEVGEVSDPVETQFGWHVLKLNDARKKDIPTLDDVRLNIEREIANEAASNAVRDAPEALSVVLREGDPVDPALIRRLDLLE